MEFYKTRQVLKARKIKLKKEGLGRKANASKAIEQEDEMKLITTGKLGKDTPGTLQFTLFYYFTKGFGIRGRDEHRQLKFGDINIKETTSGVKYLEFSERSSKTMDGSKCDNYRKVTAKIFSTGEDLDAVELFQTF